MQEFFSLSATQLPKYSFLFTFNTENATKISQSRIGIKIWNQLCSAEISVPLLNSLNTLFHSFNYYFYSAQNMTVFRDNMFIQSLNVSFMAFDSLKKNLTAEYRVVYFPSAQSHHEWYSFTPVEVISWKNMTTTILCFLVFVIFPLPCSQKYIHFPTYHFSLEWIHSDSKLFLVWLITAPFLSGYLQNI